MISDIVHASKLSIDLSSCAVCLEKRALVISCFICEQCCSILSAGSFAGYQSAASESCRNDLRFNIVSLFAGRPAREKEREKTFTAGTVSARWCLRNL